MSESMRPGFQAALRVELSAVLATDVFTRSPLLSRLLSYLADETLAGRGDTLKAYTVAVEGLGRPDDFDAKSDSYPRVQMVRLRQLLARHYAEHGPADALCIYLRAGSHRVRLAGLATAYPELYRPLSAKAGPTAPDGDRGTAPLFSGKLTRSFHRALPFARPATAAVLSLAAAFGFVALSSALRQEDARQSEQSPVIEVARADQAVDPDIAAASRVFTAQLADGLRRSWTSQVRLADQQPAGTLAGPDAAYRLDLDVERGSAGQNVLFGRLNDVRTGLLIWSKSVDLYGGASDTNDLATRLIVDVGGPDGAIVTNESRLMRGRAHSGYACIVKYFQFLKSRQAGGQDEVARCMATPVDEGRLVPTVFALRSFFALEREGPGSDWTTSIEAARAFAIKSVKADPGDAYAQLAMARIAYVVDDCRTGNHHARLALDANPYDPVVLGILAAHAKRCGNADSAALLDKAYRLRDEGDSYARLWLILGAIMQGEPERVATLPPNLKPLSDGAAINYYLCETLTAAALDQQRAAADNWAKFARLANNARSTDERLRHIILSPKLRAMTIDYLRQRRLAV